VKENGSIVDDECGAGFAGGVGEGWVAPGVECDDGYVGGGGVFFQAGDGLADFGGLGFQVGNEQEGFGLFGFLHEVGWRGNGLGVVTRVLQPVQQLAARKKFLIQNQYERMLHGKILSQARGKCKRMLRIGCCVLRKFGGWGMRQ
jgi:hypothetical protein